MGMTIMESRERRAERIEALRRLLDRLCVPDLTLAEAKVLNERLSAILERKDEWGGETDQAASSQPVAFSEQTPLGENDVR
jgi:hypothetical protein